MVSTMIHFISMLFCISGVISGLINYDYKDLKSATKNFSEEYKVGEGGFGDVYKVWSAQFFFFFFFLQLIQQ